jgi:O-acetylserine/cysteine efflux transporter
MVAPFLLLLPVFSVIGGVAFLGEDLSVRIALGGAVVIFGVATILIERSGKREVPSGA